jgi:cation diffusion facilitator CzcD-associated flavoprotein CzcO
MTRAQSSDSDAGGPYDVVVIGAGFAGLYAIHRFTRLGLSVIAFERGEGVGGVWYWNRYPGARCDCESFYYSYSFSDDLQQDWNWPRRYSEQPDILRYLDHVADRFDLRRHIRFGAPVESLAWDEAASLWRVRAANGAQAVAGRFVVTAAGNLSRPLRPDIPGLDTFEGAVWHTAAWPPEGVDFTGRRVAIVGTGASGVQAIPRIARQAEHLTVLQRTANWVLPAHNRATDPEFDAWVKANYDDIRARCLASPGAVPFDGGKRSAFDVDEAERRATYESLWQTGGMRFFSAFNDLFTNPAANATMQAFVRDKILATVEDPATAQALIPQDQPIGVKRPPVDDDYYATFNRQNVTLVDLRREPLLAVRGRALQTADRSIECDDLVLATGFDAITGALLAMDVRGRDGQSLGDAWAEGPRAYLGLAVAGFPNLFMITGPLSPSVLANMPTAVEQHVDWIAGCLQSLDARGAATIEAEPAAEDDWTAHAQQVVAHTLYTGTSSWYFGSNIPGKPRRFGVYVGGFAAYRERCEAVAEAGYAGFDVKPARVPA